LNLFLRFTIDGYCDYPFGHSIVPSTDTSTYFPLESQTVLFLLLEASVTSVYCSCQAKSKRPI